MFMLVALCWPADLRPPARWLEGQSHERLDWELTQSCIQVIRDSTLYQEGWDTLAQPQFWRAAMGLSPDSILVNFAHNRQIIDTLVTRPWRLASERHRKAYEDSVKKAWGLGREEEVYFTTGRSHFYRYEPILRHIDEALQIFLEEGVDPWYAQAILLVESPGRLQYSVDGAYGAFQLMKEVARDMGLTINDTLDERKDFEASARGAARLIKRVCLPNTRRLCEQHDLDFQESDTWFRLLTLHVYHAGARNVSRVMRKVRPDSGGVSLITELWQTKSRRFGNASQNYSQIILAAFMQLDHLLESTGVICPPDIWADPNQGRINPAAISSSDSP